MDRWTKWTTPLCWRLPDATTAEERAAVNRVAHRWTAAFLSGRMPATTDGDAAAVTTQDEKEATTTRLLPRVGDTLRLSEAVLSTEQQWWMADYTVVARVPLTAAKV